jgi:hypothetical protein
MIQFKYLKEINFIFFTYVETIYPPPPYPLTGTVDQNNCLLVYDIDIAKTQFKKCW